MAAAVLPPVLQRVGLTEASGFTLQEALFGAPVLMGMSFMVSVAFASLRWMRLLAILWWLAALGALFVPPLRAPALLNLIPGVILSRRYQARQANPTHEATA